MEEQAAYFYRYKRSIYNPACKFKNFCSWYGRFKCRDCITNLAFDQHRLNDFLKSDWPIPVDLSYSDADLQTAGLGGFPLGDLNWFPVPKTTWLAQRDAEYAYIQSSLDQGIPSGVKEIGSNLPDEFNLNQNYPNPFNPTTVISYKLPISSLVAIKVYDVLGREVQTLVNERQNAGNHSITFSASSLPSGVYFYRLHAGNYSATKKLLLLK